MWSVGTGRACLVYLLSVAKGVSLTNCNNDPRKIVIDSHTDKSSKSFFLMAKPRVSCDSEKFCGAQVQEYRAIKGKTQKDTSKLDEGQ